MVDDRPHFRTLLEKSGLEHMVRMGGKVASVDLVGSDDGGYEVNIVVVTCVENKVLVVVGWGM